MPVSLPRRRIADIRVITDPNSGRVLPRSDPTARSAERRSPMRLSHKAVSEMLLLGRGDGRQSGWVRRRRDWRTSRDGCDGRFREPTLRSDLTVLLGDVPIDVIHEGAGRVKGAVTGLGWLGVPGVVTAGRWVEAVQSSIRPRWAGRSVVRCSRAQSSSRPSVAPVGAWRPLTTHELARASAGRHGVGGIGSCAAGHGATAIVLIVRALARGVRQRISPSRRP